MRPATIDGNKGDLMTVKEFKAACENGLFTDYDGMGDLIRNGKIVTIKSRDGFFPDWVKPSTRANIPDDATHVLWYNN